MMELENIPKLTDHDGYRSCLERIKTLEDRLASARSELKRLGGGGIIQRANPKAESRVVILETQLSVEHEKIPELRRQAEEAVGAAAATIHETIAERLFEARGQIDGLLRTDLRVRARLREELSSHLPGGDGFDLGQRYLGGIDFAGAMAAG